MRLTDSNNFNARKKKFAFYQFPVTGMAGYLYKQPGQSDGLNMTDYRPPVPAE